MELFAHVPTGFEDELLKVFLTLGVARLICRVVAGRERNDRLPPIRAQNGQRLHLLGRRRERRGRGRRWRWGRRERRG